MSDGREPLRLVHHHPGRLRVRAVIFVDGAEVFARVREALEAVAGVAQVAHNPRSGSVLVEYEPGLADLDAIVERIADAAGLGEVVDDVAARAARGDPASAIARAARKVDEVVRAVGSERVGLPLLVPAALAAGAAVSAALADRKTLVPRWDTLLWWSYSIFRDLNARAIDAARDDGAP